jgi:hypothetical protein
MNGVSISRTTSRAYASCRSRIFSWRDDAVQMGMTDLPPSTGAALKRVLAQAERLRDGPGEHHVRASAHEIEVACARGEGVRAAVERLASSIRQLQAELSSGPRRREQHDAAAVERLLEVLQEDLLPTLRQAGLI